VFSGFDFGCTGGVCMSQAAPPSIPRGVPTMLHAAALRPRSKLRAGTSTGQKLYKIGQNGQNLTETGQLDQRRKAFVQIERPELDELDKTGRSWTKLDANWTKLDKT